MTMTGQGLKQGKLVALKGADMRKDYWPGFVMEKGDSRPGVDREEAKHEYRHECEQANLAAGELKAGKVDKAP